MTVTNTIVAGNGNADVSKSGGTITDGGHNLVGTSSGYSFTGTGDITGPALLAPLGSYGGSTQTQALLPGSAAIGGGDTTVCTAAPVSGVDQRGVARPPASCDIGAFQSQGFTFSAPTGSPQSTPVGTAFPTPLTLTVSSSHGEPVVGGVVTFTGPPTGAGIATSPLTASITGTAGASSGTMSQSVTANGTPGGPYAVVASTAGVPTSRVGGSVTFSLTNTQPPTITSGASTTFTVGTGGSFTVTATGFPAPIFAATGLPMGVTLDPTSGAFGGSTTVASVYTVTLTASNGVSPDATQTFTLTVNAAAGAKLAVVQGPTNTVAGGAITPAVTVQVQDQYGNNVPTAGTSVTLALGTNPAMGTLGGTLTQSTDATGLATFAGVSIAKAGVGYTLAASSGALTGATSASFTVTPGSTTRFVVTGIPSPLALGVAGSVAVTAQDALGNTATGYTGTIHFTSSDPTATLPADYAFGAGDAGAHTFTNGVAFHAVGTWLVTATDTTTSTMAGSETGITVPQGTPAVSVTSSTMGASSFGQSVTFTATVTGVMGTTPTGTAQFSYTPMGGMSTPIGSPVTLDGTGKAVSPAIATLPAGSYTITVTYSGDGNYTAGNPGTANQTVSKATPTVGVTSSTMGASSFGQSVTFTATVTGVMGTTPTGTAQFSYTPMGGMSTPIGMSVTLDMMGKAVSPAIATLPVGSYTITATYNSGDGNYLTSGGTVPQTVTKATPTVAVASSSTMNTSVFWQSVTFTATVSGIAGTTPTGSVQFASTPTGSMTSTPIGSPVTLDSTGKAVSPAIATLPVGAYTITVTYSGDGNHTTGSGTVNQSVTKAATTTSVTAMPATTTFGQSVTLTATLAVTAPGAGTPTGIVTFTLGGTSLGSGTANGMGVASTTTTTLPVGTNQTLTASYNGDPNFTTSNGTLTVTVNAVTITLTAPTGSGSGNSGTVGAPSIRAGSSITLRPNPGTGVTYTSSNPNVASVDPITGAVTGISGGTVVITASGPNGSGGSITVTVMGGTVTGLMAPAPAPVVHTGVVTAAPGATVAPQPMSHANGNGTGGGVQPQAVGGPTATPEAQPARH